MQIAVSLTDTSRPAQCFIVVLPLLTFGAGSSGPHVQRQCEGLPPSPLATTAGTTAIPHLNKQAEGWIWAWRFVYWRQNGVIGPVDAALRCPAGFTGLIADTL